MVKTTKTITVEEYDQNGKLIKKTITTEQTERSESIWERNNYPIPCYSNGPSDSTGELSGFARFAESVTTAHNGATNKTIV